MLILNGTYICILNLAVLLTDPSNCELRVYTKHNKYAKRDGPAKIRECPCAIMTLNRYTFFFFSCILQDVKKDRCY